MQSPVTLRLQFDKSHIDSWAMGSDWRCGWSVIYPRMFSCDSVDLEG